MQEQPPCPVCDQNAHFKILADSNFLKPTEVPFYNVIVYIKDVDQPDDEEEQFIKKYNKNPKDNYCFFRFINDNINAHYKDNNGYRRRFKRIRLVLDRVPTEEECKEWFGELISKFQGVEVFIRDDRDLQVEWPVLIDGELRSSGKGFLKYLSDLTPQEKDAIVWDIKTLECHESGMGTNAYRKRPAVQPSQYAQGPSTTYSSMASQSHRSRGNYQRSPREEVSFSITSTQRSRSPRNHAGVDEQLDFHSVINLRLSPGRSNFLEESVGPWRWSDERFRGRTHAMVVLKSTTLDYCRIASVNNCCCKHIGLSNPNLMDDLRNISRHCEEIINEYFEDNYGQGQGKHLDLTVVLNRVPCRVASKVGESSASDNSDTRENGDKEENVARPNNSGGQENSGDRDCYEFLFAGHEKCWIKYFKTVDLIVLDSTNGSNDWYIKIQETMKLMLNPELGIDACTLKEKDHESRQQIRKLIRRNDIGIRKHND